MSVSQSVGRAAPNRFIQHDGWVTKHLEDMPQKRNYARRSQGSGCLYVMGIYDGKVPTSGESLPEARWELVPSLPGRDCCILSNLTGGWSATVEHSILHSTPTNAALPSRLMVSMGRSATESRRDARGLTGVPGCPIKYVSVRPATA